MVEIVYNTLKMLYYATGLQLQIEVQYIIDYIILLLCSGYQTRTSCIVQYTFMEIISNDTCYMTLL